MSGSMTGIGGNRPAAVVEQYQAAVAREGGWAISGAQLPVVQQMLATLDTLTMAGQQHLMSKILGFLEDQWERAGRVVGGRNRQVVAEMLEHLARDRDRFVPDIRTFVRHADCLLALLAAIA